MNILVYFVQLKNQVVANYFFCKENNRGIGNRMVNNYFIAFFDIPDYFVE